MHECLVAVTNTNSLKITQGFQAIHDIKLRRLLITGSDKEPHVITDHILTNKNDHKDTSGSDRSKPEILGIHEGNAEGGINYAYKTPNHHKLGNQDILQHHDTYQPHLPPKPSGMTPEPLPYPDPSEAFEIPSLLPTSLLLPPKKDNNELNALLMYMERPNLSLSLCLAPTKKYG